MTSSSRIRERFLSFFQENAHTLVPSSSLVPEDDPTLLFTNAGMVQFKKVFLGQENRDYSRAVTSQKCLRVGGKHNDLENVGRTARHHTFFEMLGNFSFGDYFKKDAIDLAWKFLTREMNLAPAKLYITVFRDDDEAARLWQETAGVPDGRIFRLDEKDNFWSMGDTGPCGPCSEILYDQGPDMACGPECGIGVCECDRYLEIWNLVFMQYDRDEAGQLNPLPSPSIDTGMGLERISAVCQGVYSNYDTDLFRRLIDFTAGLASTAYHQNSSHDVALRVIADHARAGAFMVADGILPSNEGRGYILRRLVRRAYRFGRSMGLDRPFLHLVCNEVVKAMGEAYPELEESARFMVKVISQEEERFAETLEKGLVLLEEAISELEAGETKVIPGEVAFKLYDTYGFPLDIVQDIAETRGFHVDEQEYARLMSEQRQRAKAAWKGAEAESLFSGLGRELPADFHVRFTGYDHLKDNGVACCLLNENGTSVDRLRKGEKGWLVSPTTPFYGESGGQVGDRGRIISASGQARVYDTRRTSAGIIVHEISISSGEIEKNQQVHLVVDDGRRIATARNHTATHLLHAALRQVLGEHVRQAGSLVDHQRLRFDFTHIKALTPEELERIEDEVNQAILEDIPVLSQEMDRDQAVEKGALALFGEKYQEKVRVISVGQLSMELCGGTHLESTARAGSFCILSEGAVSSGVRRIEAATGREALKFWRENRSRLESIQALLKTGPEQIEEKVSGLQEQLRQVQRENRNLKEKLSSGAGDRIVASALEVAGVKVVAHNADDADMNSLRKLMDDIRSRMPSGAAMLASVHKEKPLLLLYVSRDLHEKFTAPQLIKKAAAEIKGSGGGRPDLAQAGGADPSGVDKALERFKDEVARQG